MPQFVSVSHNGPLKFLLVIYNFENKSRNEKPTRIPKEDLKGEFQMSEFDLHLVIFSITSFVWIQVQIAFRFDDVSFNSQTMCLKLKQRLKKWIHDPYLGGPRQDFAFNNHIGPYIYIES